MSERTTSNLIPGVFLGCLLVSTIMLGGLVRPFIYTIGGVKLFGILGIIYGPLVITAFLTLTGICRASYQYIIETRETR